ncbi:Regulator of SigK [Tumidithrix helvetica PCC 7403]|uniref:anti-sigma factor n=1 Tax=Tumidithrix helvetica TaxID=3457545 RepID=UPI003C971EEB
MTGREQPEAMQELLAGYVLGDLTPYEVESVLQLLSDRPEFQTEVDRLQETLSLLPYALPETAPDIDLRSRILEQAQAEMNLETASDSALSNSPVNSPASLTVNPSPNPLVNPALLLWRQPKIWLGAIAGLAAIGFAGLSIDAYRLRQELAIAQAELSSYRNMVALLPQPNNRLLSLKGMGTTPTASGSLVIVPQGNSALLTIQNLPPLPKGKMYRLWSIVNGKKMDCGNFQADASGKVFVKVPLGEFLMGTNAVVITVEPSATTPEPTGEMVMKGEISL